MTTQNKGTHAHLTRKQKVYKQNPSADYSEKFKVTLLLRYRVPLKEECGSVC